MKYLIESSSLTIEPRLAVALGLNEAIFLRQLFYWLTRSKHIRDGKKWVFNSLKDWQKQLPFLSEKTIQRSIENLHEKGFIQIEKLDKNSMNRTNWYTISFLKLEELKKELKIEKTSLIEAEKESKKQQKKSQMEGEFSDLFLEFWGEFPKKHGKRVSFGEFQKLSDEEKEVAIKAAKSYFEKTYGVEDKYIKTPKKWLEERYFEDFIEESKKEKSKAPQDSFIEIMTNKILYILEKNESIETDFWEQMDGGVSIFNRQEKNILKNIGYGFNEYKELNFQDGEIKAYLKGVLDD